MKQAMIDYMQKTKHDHFNTPAYAVKPLLPYIKPRWTIWEPTDTTGDSEITRVLKDHGCTVISTSKTKFDFLTDEPDFKFDCIITNPPYTLKNDFIRRCIYHSRKNYARWALLLPLTALEGIERRKLFESVGQFLGIMVLDRRVEFTGKSVWFNTSWFCYGLLPGQLMFEELCK